MVFGSVTLSLQCGIYAVFGADLRRNEDFFLGQRRNEAQNLVLAYAIFRLHVTAGVEVHTGRRVPAHGANYYTVVQHNAGTATECQAGRRDASEKN